MRVVSVTLPFLLGVAPRVGIASSSWPPACFDILRGAGRLTEEISPLGSSLTHLVKGMARHLGAKLVGIVELDPAFVYSPAAEGREHYGEPVRLPHRITSRQVV